MKPRERKEYYKQYYKTHKKEIKLKRRARYAAKEVAADFFSNQLERIINVLWWICFAISFVGVSVLFF